MSDGITDAYREEAAWDRKVRKLRANLKEQEAEMLYYKAKHLHDLAHDLWTGYKEDKPPLRQLLHKPGVDLKVLLLDYINQLKEILELPDALPAGQRLGWYSDDCFLKFKKHTME
jgi:hypothetical protein